MTDLTVLDMGIWSDDGTVWLPKALYPTRSSAKMFAVETLDHDFLDVRVRTRWMIEKPDYPGDEQPYYISEKGVEGAFECWEIT